MAHSPFSGVSSACMLRLPPTQKDCLSSLHLLCCNEMLMIRVWVVAQIHMSLRPAFFEHSHRLIALGRQTFLVHWCWTRRSCNFENIQLNFQQYILEKFYLSIIHATTVTIKSIRRSQVTGLPNLTKGHRGHRSLGPVTKPFLDSPKPFVNRQNFPTFV